MRSSRGSVISLGNRGDGRNSAEFQVGWRLSGLGGYILLFGCLQIFIVLARKLRNVSINIKVFHILWEEKEG